MKTTKILFLFLLITQFVFSQGTKRDYREKFAEGNLLLLEKNYLIALKVFKEAYLIDSSNANINYKMGLCYLQSGNEKYKAVRYLEKAVLNVTHNYNPEDVNEKRAPEFAYYNLGEAYRDDYKFDQSSVYFKKFKDLVGTKNSELSGELNKQITTNANAVEFVKDSAKVSVINLGDSVNTPFPDYSPALSADESTLIFTSRRPGSTGGEKTPEGLYMEDIYVSNKKADGTWSSAESIGLNINTSGNEANIGLSPNGDQLFVYKDINGGDIYTSKFDGDTWSMLLPLSPNINTPAWETHATISIDGSAIYFVSDRKEGSQGGRDIWRCVKLPNGTWGVPYNLGPTINTPGDEDSPFLHPDGVTLFFSSTGHKNMGGFDVFKSIKNEDGNWSEPENLRAPINTPDDDIFYVQSADGKRGYISSNRKGNFGETDIYRIDYEKANSVPLTLLKGIITFNGKSNAPAHTRILVTDAATGEVIQEIRPNEKTGKYVMILAPGVKGKTYNMSFEADGYQPLVSSIVIPPNSSYQEIDKEFILQMINLESKTLGTMTVKGVVRNKDGKAIPGAAIVIKDNLTGSLIETFYTTIDSGSYYFVLNRGQNYNVSYEAKGYLFQSVNINVPKVAEYSVMVKDIILDRVEIGSKIVLNNIFFDSNKSILRKESAIEIDKLVILMKEYPELTIEVSGHTDSKGNAGVNLKLSQSRSQSVVNALVKKGISIKSLVAKGYGKTMPIAPNALPNGKPDLKGMQMNRRVEMKIVSGK